MASDPLALVDEWPVGRVAVVARTRGGLLRRGDTADPFPLASVTKLLTACAVLLAAEEEIVALDQPAGPEGATLADLLAHSSGMSPDDPETAVARPRTRRVYSNAGYETAAGLVERAAGMSFAEYLREGVLVPLGMEATRLDGSPAHGATGSADDLMAFVDGLLAGSLLAPPTLAAMTSPHLPGLQGVLPGFGRQEDNQWGLGPEIRDAKSPHWTGGGNSPATWGHFGRTGTFVWVDPEAPAALVCLTDREFGDWAFERWPALADAVLAAGG